jgi:hypothetical protein
MIRIGWLVIYTDPDWWRYMWLRQALGESWYGIFRNMPHVMPGRWGFYVLGIEFGSRDPGHWFGLWLRRCGLWPW